MDNLNVLPRHVDAVVKVVTQHNGEYTTLPLNRAVEGEGLSAQESRRAIKYVEVSGRICKRLVGDTRKYFLNGEASSA
jgi:hypothetical protein